MVREKAFGTSSPGNLHIIVNIVIYLQNNLFFKVVTFTGKGSRQITVKGKLIVLLKTIIIWTLKCVRDYRLF